MISPSRWRFVMPSHPTPPSFTSRTGRSSKEKKNVGNVALQEFMSIVEAKIFGKSSKEELPEHFMRAFLNNKPMPFSAKAHT